MQKGGRGETKKGEEEREGDPRVEEKGENKKEEWSFPLSIARLFSLSLSLSSLPLRSDTNNPIGDRWCLDRDRPFTSPV